MKGKRRKKIKMESSYNAIAKLYDRVPLVTRAGTEIQIKDALARRPGASLWVEDLVDESIVRELVRQAHHER